MYHIQKEVNKNQIHQDGVDYLVLVNRDHPLPSGWEETIELIELGNSRDEKVPVERKTSEAFLKLAEALRKEGVVIQLDSAYRSVQEQQELSAQFAAQYGDDYARQYVAVPGYSEHHTGLALDLYLQIDGRDVVLNEDLVRYPQIWKIIHHKLPEFGFILRYPEGKEAITGYSYEPWHIRYIDDAGKAIRLTERGLVLEENG